jgi:protein TonB
MAHAIGMRATSFAASAALLGLATLAALTMSLVQRPSDLPFEQYLPFTTVVEPPADPPKQQEAPPPLAASDEGEIRFTRTDQELPLIPATNVVGGGAVSGGGPPNIVDPHWVRVPRNLDRYYPRRALERGMEGSVTLNCAVDTGGRLHCAVLSETPQNWGFAEAALRISRDYQMVPATRDGVAVQGRHQMVIPFRVQ